ncbi:unnamed protein product [Adineta ricciae]|uniref:Mono(ADP-ribosyl)transferase n=1 Tax=Adineta ricciae TaxID=249248 RepID=A0A815R9L1_ADIRI|nr:unnamed protein product [Adineta ricciae]CAF1474028.1 unnamed protein product [Adineta ricciae]
MSFFNCTESVPTIEYHNQSNEISELYRACVAGNVEQARALLVNMPFILMNTLEPNGSTALHAASERGYVDIVRLLVHEYGVIRSRRNAEGLTAYEVAANDEVRQLFHRPQIDNSFGAVVEDAAVNAFAMFFPESRRRRPGWIHSTSGWLKVKNIESKRKKSKLIQNNRFLNVISTLNNGRISDLFPSKREIKTLRRMIDNYIKPTHKYYQLASKLLSKFEETGNVEHLLTIYTLETPFYNEVGGPKRCYALLKPLIRNLNTLRRRHYQGTSYRGLSMTKEDLEEYEHAMEQGVVRNKKSVITLASFASTSRDIRVALFFLDAYRVEGKTAVLFTLSFSEVCDTAVTLYRTSESTPSISAFEDEEEILVYPGTMFQVTAIDSTSDPSITHIHLTNVMPEYHLGAVVLDSVKKRVEKKFIGALV